MPDEGCKQVVRIAGAVRLRGTNSRGTWRKRWGRWGIRSVFWLCFRAHVRTRHGRKENHVLFLDNVRITRAFSFLVFHPRLPKITEDLRSSETCKCAHVFSFFKEAKEGLMRGWAVFVFPSSLKLKHGQKSFRVCG